MKQHWIIAAVLATQAFAPMAQTVYESKDKAGPVFSDRPSPGAKPIQLEQPNVVDSPAVAPQPAPSASAPAPPPYRRLAITRPAEQGMVHSNTGEFGIDANLSPSLRRTDRVRVIIDGNLVPTVFNSTSVRISESDWQSSALALNGEHTLQMAVIGEDGKPLIESRPVRFYVRRTAIGGGGGRR